MANAVIKIATNPAPPWCGRLAQAEGAASRGIWTRSSAVQLSRQVTCDFHAGFGFLDLWFQPFIHDSFPFLLRARLPRGSLLACVEPFALGRVTSRLSFVEKALRS